MIKSIHELDARLRQITHAIEKELTATKLFITMFIQLDLIIDEMKMMIRAAMDYLQHLRSQINFLSIGQVTPSLISPTRLRALLLTIKSQLPALITLIADPEQELWLFYKYLTSTAVFDKGKIIIVLAIPVLRVDRQYEVHKALNVPIPLAAHTDTDSTDNILTTDSTNMIATYDLEATAFLIDKQRNKYVMLTSEESRICSNANIKWCAVTSPVYPVNIAKTYLINMFMMNDVAIREYCNRIISTSQQLPFAQHLIGLSWVIASHTELRFTLVCDDRNVDDVIVKHPLGVIQVPEKCVANNKHFALSAPYVINGQSELLDDDKQLLREVNWSNTRIWDPVIKTFPNFPSINLPGQLQDIKQVSMESMIDQLHDMREVNVKTDKAWTFWAYLSLVTGGITFVLSLAMVAYCYATKKWAKLWAILKTSSQICVCNWVQRDEDSPSLDPQMENVSDASAPRRMMSERGQESSTLMTGTEAIVQRLYPNLEEITRL
jgi:hypothetical protein